MDISLEKLIAACKEVGISEDDTLKLINILSSNGTKAFHQEDIPMKVKNNYTWGNHDQRPDGNCPVCNYDLSGNANTPKVKRCPGCNQLLDWH